MSKKIKGAPGSLPITLEQPEASGVQEDLAGAYAAAAEQERQYQASGLTDKAQAAFRTSGLTSLLIDSLNRPDFVDEPGWSTPSAELQGYTENEQEQLREARSRPEFNFERSMIGYARADQEELGRSGAGTAFAASMIAGFPEAILTGKVFGLPFQAAARSRNLVTALKASAASNIGGNIAATALEDAFSHRVSKEDYVMGAAFGAFGTGLEMLGHWRGKGGTAMEAAVRDSAERRGKAEAQAIENLGPNADPKKVAAEATRIETASLIEDQRSATAALGDDRKLLPDIEKLRADEEAAEAAAAKAQSEEGAVELRGYQGDLTDPRLYTKSVNGNETRPLVKSTLSARDLLTKIGENEKAPELVRSLASRLLGTLAEQDVEVHIVAAKDMHSINPGANRAHYDPNRHMVFLAPGDLRAGSEHVITHELAHAATSHKLFLAEQAPEGSTLRQTAADIGALRKQVTDAWEKAGKPDTTGGTTKYLLKNDHEFVAGLYSGESSFIDFLKSVKVDGGATAFNKFVEAVRRLLGIPDEQADAFTHALNLSEKLIDAKAVIKLGDKTSREVVHAPPARPGATPVDLSFLQDPIATKYGLDALPVDTATRRAEARAMIELYRKADDPKALWNNVDQKRLDNLLQHTPALGSTGLQMLRSENPVARMFGSELLETTTGAGGRKSTAALAKYLIERKLMGNVINEYQSAYREWRNAAGGSITEDYFKGKMWERFNRAVAEEIEARRDPEHAKREDRNPAVVAAADRIEAGFERARSEQVNTKTTGWAALPETSTGYLPHKLSASKVRQLSKAQQQALHSALVDQFVDIEGWDMSFAANLASKYIERIRKRALGGYASDMGRHSPGAADVVQDALEAMGMAPDEVRAQMQKYMRGAPGHTKKRINLDLTREYTDEAGQSFKLLDLFDTDVLGLVRSQSRRVSGEVALARHGIMGKSGLKLIRQAMEFGDNGSKAQLSEFDAFDQVSAEFLGEPFGNYGGKWMNRAMQLNSLVRLGGMGFTQAAETINAAVHLGMGRALAVIGGFGRLRGEAVKLAKGEKVDSILNSIETMGGAEFGTDSYKLVFPFENPDLQYAVHGVDTAHAADRLLSGGIHAQGKLSFWRAIHAAQQRGVAEQIVLKSLRYIRDGVEDTALADMGITKQVAADMRAELGNIAQFDGDGRVTHFDITKMENLESADAFVQSVHRGVGQIIQGTFIGETGKWAHEGYLKLLTQFRTFSLTSVEKQWARNRANYGLASSVGILMGSMAACAPIYLARTYLSSMGRPDQDEYLRKKLDPWVMSRATLNYVAMSGLAPDFIDAMAGIAGVSTTGGRIGTGSEFVGSVVAPAAGLLDDMYKAIQNTKEGTDLHGVVENLPLAKLPMLLPVINLMDE